MFNFSIRNSAHVNDIGRERSADSFRPTRLLIKPLKAFSEEAAQRRVPSYRVFENNAFMKDADETMSPLTGLFSSFLTRLTRFASGGKNKTIAVIPTPAPPITEQGVPESVMHQARVPRPNPAAFIPGLSSKRGGAKPDNIWSGFRQGPDGNCVTVSAIKVAMQRCGQSPTDIYQQVTRFYDGYRVVMRDGFELSLTDRELAQGAQGAQFKGWDEGMLKDAQFLFAVSAKRAQMEDNDDAAGCCYQAAILSLNDGEDEHGPGEALLRLGLRQYMRTVSPRDLARGQVGICNRGGHSVAVIHGREEKWGRPGAAPTWGDAIALV
jgi:hypothetical protein